VTRPGIQHVIVDIEGTTTPVSFVTTTLFPYARARLAHFVAQHGASAEVRSALDEARALLGKEAADDAEVVSELLSWIDEDRKATPLKTLQGLIWRDGYTTGQFVAPVYDDVPVNLRAWKERGLRLHVYSSGSVEAQRLLFGHTSAGSLLDLFERYFDTHIGPKVEAGSYQRIATEIRSEPERCLFLTDNPAEASAALDAGWQAIRIDRERQPSADMDLIGGSLVAPSFTAVEHWMRVLECGE
jgi:enolase-phosphatase E1